MLVEDGEIVKIFSEADMQDNCPTDPFEVSDAGTMLNYVRGRNAG
jgi:peroxiredoxin